MTKSYRCEISPVYGKRHLCLEGKCPDYAHARASSAFSLKDNRTDILTRQDFLPDRRRRFVVNIPKYYKYFRLSKKSFVLYKIWLAAPRLAAILTLWAGLLATWKARSARFKNSFSYVKLVSEVSYCSRSSLKRSRDINKNAISTRWIIAKVSQKFYYDFIALVFLNMLRLSVWFCRPKGGSFKSLLTRCRKKLCFTKLNSTKSPQSHPCLNDFFFTESYYCCFISAYSFYNYISLYGSWQKEYAFNRHQKASHLLVLRLTAIKVTPKIPDFAQIET